MVVNGYETKTTFWDDFTIADAYGESAIKDTYERAFESWKDNVEFVTELVLVLNWKCWDFYYKGKSKLSDLYSKLYYKAHHWCCSHLKGDDFDYYFSIVD